MIVPNGQWNRTDGDSPEWTGTCQLCNSTVPAVMLELHRLPFGRGEVWKCRPSCSRRRFNMQAAMLRELRKIVRGES